jgi:quinoprotein glucose dehydrogenase
MNREDRPDMPRPPRGATAPPFSFKLPNGTYVSCAATPWGELVAVDVNRQRIAWRAPLGSTANLGPSSGARNLGGSMVTASGLVFIGASNDRRVHAYDAKTGKVLWEASLEASAHSTPITYLGKNGKQYVVMAAAGGTSAAGPEMSDTVVAFALP